MSKVPRIFSQVRGLNEPAARPASESIRSRFRSTSLHSPVDRIQAVFRSSVLVSRQNMKPLQPSSFCAHERRHPSPRGLGLSPTCRTRTAGCRGLPARQAHTCHAPSRFTPFVRCFRLSLPSTASHHHRGVRNAFAASAARSGDPADGTGIHCPLAFGPLPQASYCAAFQCLARFSGPMQSASAHSLRVSTFPILLRLPGPASAQRSRRHGCLPAKPTS
jgi:hypothetical protein